MTTINLLAGDFVLEFADEFITGGSNRVGTRRIARGGSPSLTVHTSNALYSAVAEVSDDFIAMGFKNPMLPVTPNEYTMENQYFITRECTEFLSEGTITGIWTALTNPGDGVLAKIYSGGTDFDPSDIGRQVTEGAYEGTLLDFEVLPDGLLLAWIRPSDPTTDLFDGTGALAATGGIGASAASIAATNGSVSYNAMQAIGSVPTATEVYVVQDRIKLTDQAGAFQWWATDPTVNLGIVSILVRTTDPATGGWPLLKDGDLEIFSRRYTALYDNFRLNVAGGGFQALPLASSPDINNTTGDRRVTEVGATGTGPFVVGDVATEAVSGAQVVITAVGGTTATPILQYYLVSDVTIDLFSSGAQTLTRNGGGATMTTAAPIVNLLGPTDPAAGQGGTVTLALGNNQQDHDGDGTLETYSITVDAQSDVLIAKVYERIKYITRRGAIADMITGMNVPGETYRGLDGTFEYDAVTGLMVEGDDLIISTRTGFSARLMCQENAPPGAEVTHITMTDIQSSLAANQPANDDIVDDEASNDVTIHGAGTFGIETYTSPKSSPFGTFTGSQIFGARGVFFANPNGADTQAYILTDNLGILRTPPNTVAFIVSNTRVGDRILVARDTDVAGIINKDQFGGIETPAVDYNSEDDRIIRAAGVLDAEVPQSGFVRVVETTLQQEHHYVYDTVNLVDEEFNLRNQGTSYAGTATAGTSDIALEDTGQTFQADNVLVGMLIRILSGGGAGNVYEIVDVVGEESLTIVQIFGTGGGFVIGATYQINSLIQTYATSDDIYDLLLDVEETIGSDITPGTEQNTFVQSTTFDVVVNVRLGGLGGILPFTQNAEINASGGGVTVVRADDTIAT